MEHLSISKEDIEICKEKKLGKGHFGEVYRGVYTDIGNKNEPIKIDVAIKMMKDSAHKIDRNKSNLSDPNKIRDFLEEAKLMR